MFPEDEIQDELLDRLVDGELPDRDYRQTIRQLEDSPDGWRRCALSFLEQQALQQELKQLLKDGERLEPADDAIGELELDEPGVPRVTTQDRWERWLGQPWIRWTSVLAVGVLAFVGGVALRPFGPSDDAVAGRDKNGAASNVPSTIAESRPIPREDRATLFIEDPLAGRSKPLQVPVLPVDSSNGSGIPRFAPDGLPPQLVNALGEYANLTRIERRVFIVQTPDGRVFILPFDRIIQGDNFQ